MTRIMRDEDGHIYADKGEADDVALAATRRASAHGETLRELFISETRREDHKASAQAYGQAIPQAMAVALVTTFGPKVTRVLIDSMHVYVAAVEATADELQKRQAEGEDLSAEECAAIQLKHHRALAAAATMAHQLAEKIAPGVADALREAAGKPAPDKPPPTQH